MCIVQMKQSQRVMAINTNTHSQFIHIHHDQLDVLTHVHNEISTSSQPIHSPAGTFLPSKSVSFVRHLAMTGTGGYILMDSFRHIVRYSKQFSLEMSSLHNKS